MSQEPTVARAMAQAMQLGLDRNDAQWLMLHLMAPASSDRAWLITHDHLAMSATQWSSWQAMVARRLDGLPVAYLTGRKYFYGLELHINEQVLDPRPDTETLVDWALDLLHDERPARVLDMGTGSGAVALALAAQAAHAQVSGSDRSEAALAVARANGQRLGLSVNWLQGDWFDAVTGAFDLIVSNPPYINERDPHLLALRHEPREALVSGEDGLADVRHLVEHAPIHLKPGGWMLLEHGHDQARAVRTMLMDRGFAQVQSRKDLAGIERCSGGQWPEVE